MTFVPDECLTWWKCEYVHVNFSRRTRVLIFFENTVRRGFINLPFSLWPSSKRDLLIILANIHFLDLKILDVKVIDEYALAITDYL